MEKKDTLYFSSFLMLAINHGSSMGLVWSVSLFYDLSTIVGNLKRKPSSLKNNSGNI